MLKKEEKKKHTLLKIFIIICIFLFIVCFYSKSYEIKHIVTKEYKLESEKIPSSFSSVKIIHFSDINYGTSIYHKELEGLVDKINSYNPEVVVFTGNLIYKKYNYNDEDLEFIKENLSKINASVGKYAVCGINDNRLNEYISIMESADFKVLNNSFDLIYYKGYTPIYIGGLSSYLTTKIDLDSTLSYFNDEEDRDMIYKIMLVNESDGVDEILKYKSDIDLILSGNTLGGVINVPFYGPLFKEEGSSKYIKDYYEIGNTKIFVSGGVGTTGLNMRLFNYPSINLYRLN